MILVSVKIDKCPDENMASSDQIQSSTDEIEGRTYPGCSPCSDDGSYTAAGHYCVECEMYFCGKCVKYHNKMPALKCHQVNNVAPADSNLTSLKEEVEKQDAPPTPTESLKCPLHHNKCIDTYCKDHDDVCCGTCAIIKHRSCTTEDISTIAKGFKKSPAVNQRKDELNAFVIQLNEHKEKQTKNLTSVEKEKLKYIAEIDNYEEEVIAKIRKLADNSRQEIRSKYEEHKTAITCDVAAVENVESSIGTYVDKLDRTELEELLFAIVKTSKIAMQDGEQFLDTMVADWEERTISFNIDEKLRQTLNKLECIGQLENDYIVKKYKATFLQEVSVRCDNDYYCHARDMCVMSTGDIIVTANSNRKIIRLSSDLQLKDEIVLPDQPMAICKISENEVAVRIERNKVVQIVLVGETLELTSSFKLAGDGHGCGMTYDASTGEIYSCENDKVNVYNKTGQILRTYDTDTKGEKIFSTCMQIVLSDNNQDIYVTDSKAGLIVLGKNGTLKRKVAVANVSDPWPLCVLPGNICLVGGEKTRVFEQIDKQGNSLGNIIDRKDGPECTYCAVYDQDNSRLIVGADADRILIYKLSAAT